MKLAFRRQPRLSGEAAAPGDQMQVTGCRMQDVAGRGSPATAGECGAASLPSEGLRVVRQRGASCCSRKRQSTGALQASLRRVRRFFELTLHRTDAAQEDWVLEVLI